MKRLLALAVCLPLLGLTSLAQAQTATYVEGPIQGEVTWAASGSPYVLTDEVVVEAAATLTIEAGTRIEGDGTANLLVHGRLIAEGDPDSRIEFTRRVGNPSWGGIQLTGASSSTSPDSLVNAEISDARVGLFVSLTTPVLESLTFKDNDVAVKLVTLEDTLSITDSVFFDNRVAIAGRARGIVDVNRSDFWSNNVNFVAGPKRVYDCASGQSEWQVHGNDIVRGPRNSGFYSYDVRTPPGTYESDYVVDFSGNWWGTNDEERLRGRFSPEVSCCPGPAKKPVSWRPPSAAAHTGWVPPGEIPDPDPPTSSTHGDPAFVLGISSPHHGQCIANNEFQRIEGYASAALASPPDFVKIAVRRQAKGYGWCQWWSDEKQRLVGNTCGYGEWTRVRVKGDVFNEHWSYRFPRSLPKGRYTVFVRVPRADPRVYGCSDAGRGCVHFRLN